MAKMIPWIIAAAGSFALATHLPPFLVMQFFMFEVDPQLLAPPMTITNLSVMWLYIASISLIGLAVMLCFIDFLFLHFRHRRVVFWIAMFHFSFVILLIGGGFLYERSDNSDLVISSLLSTSRLDLAIGAVSSAALLLLCVLRESLKSSHEAR